LFLAGRGERLVQQRQKVAPELPLTANRGLGAVAQGVVCRGQQVASTMQFGKPGVGVAIGPLLASPCGAEPDYLAGLINPCRAAMRRDETRILYTRGLSMERMRFCPFGDVGATRLNSLRIG